MGDFQGNESSHESGQGWGYARQLRKVCPVCGEIIADKSETCRGCIWEWKAIKADPTRLAW